MKIQHRCVKCCLLFCLLSCSFPLSPSGCASSAPTSTTPPPRSVRSVTWPVQSPPPCPSNSGRRPPCGASLPCPSNPRTPPRRTRSTAGSGCCKRRAWGWSSWSGQVSHNVPPLGHLQYTYNTISHLRVYACAKMTCILFSILFYIFSCFSLRVGIFISQQWYILLLYLMLKMVWLFISLSNHWAWRSSSKTQTHFGLCCGYLDDCGFSVLWFKTSTLSSGANRLSSFCREICLSFALRTMMYWIAWTFIPIFLNKVQHAPLLSPKQ